MSKLYSLHDLVGYEQDNLRNGIKPIPGLDSGVGLEVLVPGGVPRDKVSIIFADEGMMKTTMVTQMQYTMAARGPVVAISLEDSATLCAHRILGRLSGVSFGRIHGGLLSPEETAAVLAAERSPSLANYFVVDDIEPTIDQCFKAALAIPGCQALFIDYVQMLQGPGDLKSVLDNAVVASQRFARQHKIAVVMVSQRKTIDMEGARRDNPRPVTGDMFGSSSLRMGVKLAVGLFRPWTWAKCPTSVKGPYGMYVKWLSANTAHIDMYPQVLEVHVTKQVAGPSGAYHVLVNSETGEIKPYDMREWV